MTPTDEIREFIYKRYIAPARKNGLRRITIVSGDVSNALELKNRMPQICGAIGATKFQTKYGLKLNSRTGPQAGSTVTWIFSI